MLGLAGRSGIVAAGIVANGLGTLAMLALASRAFTVEQFAVFATWWIVATLIAFPVGVFEAMLAREAVADVAAGRRAGSSTGTIAGRAGLIALVVGVGLAAGDPLLSRSLFDHHGGLGIVLGIYLLASLVLALERGYAAGHDRFALVSGLLAGDGILRATATLGAAVLGLNVVAAAGAVVGAAVGTALIGHLRLGSWVGRLRIRNASLDFSTALLLLAGAAGPILINNGSVPWLSARGATAIVIGSFSGVLTLSRIPTQLGGAVFGPLLNRLSHAIEAGDRELQRALNARALAVAAIASTAFVAAFTGVGQVVIAEFLGSEYSLPAWVFALLAASSGLMLVSIVAQVQAAAHAHWVGIAVSWLIAAAAFVAALLVPGSLIFRASFAPVCSSAVGLVALIVTGKINRPQVQRWRP